MISMLEKELEKQLKDDLKEMGYLCLKFESPGNTGVPDRIILDKTGHAYFIELKQSNTARVAKKQVYWNKQLNKRGFEAYFIRNKEELEDFIYLLKDRESNRVKRIVSVNFPSDKEEKVPLINYDENEKITLLIELTRKRWISVMNAIDRAHYEAEDYDEWVEMFYLATLFLDEIIPCKDKTGVKHGQE